MSSTNDAMAGPQGPAIAALPEWMISVDDHLLEPGHIWQDRVPVRMREHAPQLVRTEAGRCWSFDGALHPTSGMAAAVNHEGKVSVAPLDWDELSPACYEPRARVADMDRDGVLASLCFPSFARFCGQTFSLHDDKVLALACLRAYNDWLIEEWAGAAPGRLMPLLLLPLWDPHLAAAELERGAERGAAAFAFSENPAALGFPSIHDASYHWDPLFDCAAQAGMPVCMHMGSSSVLPQTSADAPYIVSVSLAPTSAMFCLNDWLFSGQLIRHPDLKLCLSEGGIGWIPYIIERASYVLDRNRDWVEADEDGLDERAGGISGKVRGARREAASVPLDQLFRDHVFGCFIDDLFGVDNIEAVGIDNVMMETDYPHVDSTWPNSLAIARERLSGLDPVDAEKLMQGNARRVFSNFEFADEASLSLV